MKSKLKKLIFVQKFYYKLLYLWQKRNCKNIGKNTYIDKSVHIVGLENIRIGSNNIVSDGCWLNVNDRYKDKIGIDMGNNCYIGKRNFFSSGYLIKLGSYTMTSVDCKFLGSSHAIDNPLIPYVTTETITTETITTETNVWLGAGVTILGNVTIGRGSIIGAGSFVLKDIPPFSIAVGNPCKVVKRYDFKLKKWVKIEDYDKLNEKYIPCEKEYLDKLNEKYKDISMPLFASGKNFGDLY